MATTHHKHNLPLLVWCCRFGWRGRPKSPSQSESAWGVWARCASATQGSNSSTASRPEAARRLLPLQLLMTHLLLRVERLPLFSRHSNLSNLHCKNTGQQQSMDYFVAAAPVPFPASAGGLLPSWWCARAAASTYWENSSRRLWCRVSKQPCAFMNAMASSSHAYCRCVLPCMLRPSLST